MSYLIFNVPLELQEIPIDPYYDIEIKE